MDDQLGLTLWPAGGRSRPVGIHPAAALTTDGWDTDGRRYGLAAPTRSDDEDGPAPSWWVSDEEASQSFLRAEGITLD